MHNDDMLNSHGAGRCELQWCFTVENYGNSFHDSAGLLLSIPRCRTRLYDWISVAIWLVQVSKATEAVAKRCHITTSPSYIATTK